MATTIQISDNVKSNLDSMKLFERETYNEVVERLVEEDMELSEKTEKEIELAIKRVKSGKFLTQEEVEKKLGL